MWTFEGARERQQMTASTSSGNRSRRHPEGKNALTDAPAQPALLPSRILDQVVGETF
jgi:hypothetical protein